jgi:hypothetical protein
VLVFYLWAGREFGWSQDIVDNTDLSYFLDLYVLDDKINHPDDYLPGEFYFHP